MQDAIIGRKQRLFFFAGGSAVGFGLGVLLCTFTLDRKREQGIREMQKQARGVKISNRLDELPFAHPLVAHSACAMKTVLACITSWFAIIAVALATQDIVIADQAGASDAAKREPAKPETLYDSNTARSFISARRKTG